MMSVYDEEVLPLVIEVCEEQNLRVCIKESLMGGLIAGTTTTIGGLLAGPIGLGIGGTVGGIAAALLAQEKFKSVADVIRNDLTSAQKEALIKSVKRKLNSVNAWDIIAITAFVCQPSMKEVVLREVMNYFKNQLKMQIID